MAWKPTDFEEISDGATVWRLEGENYSVKFVFENGHLNIFEKGRGLGAELDFERVEALRDLCNSWMAWRRGDD